MAAKTFPNATPKVGSYNQAAWVPLMDSRLDPGYLKEVLKYGLNSYIFDFMEICGRTMDLSTRTPKIFEKGEWENTVKIVGPIATGAAGADISFVVHADDVDAYGNLPIAERESVVIPAQYQATGEDRTYVVTDITGTTVTATPLSGNGSSGYPTESQISVAVPAAITLSFGSYYTAPGMSLPEGRNDYRTVRQYNTHEIEAVKTFEEGIQALKWYNVPSECGTGAWFTGQEDLELEYRKKMEMALMLGEENDNASLVGTSGAGGSNKYLATKGVWRWAKEVGQALNYSGGFDISYLYDYKDLALANNLVSREALFLMGSDLQRSVEEGGLDWIKEYSGGSDLFKATDEIGYNVRRILVNGVTFQLQELKSWSNPLRMGNKNYNFSKYGIIIPEGEQNATIDGKTEKHPSFMTGYLNHGGENRRRITGVYAGTTGNHPYTSHDAGFDKMYIKSEMAAIVLRPEQLVTVEPEA